MAQINDDGVKELYGMLTELKLSSQSLVIKMDQIYRSIETLEVTVEQIKNSADTQGNRLTILEQKMPEKLKQDIALLQSAQETYSRILWLVGSAAIAALIQSIFKLL